MTVRDGSSDRIRFGLFELNRRESVLLKSGNPVKLSEKPFQMLSLLAGSPGKTVSREALIRHLWPDGTFVDFDNNLNTTVRMLREVLGDQAGNPRFIETVPRNGYRFIAPVEIQNRGIRKRWPFFVGAWLAILLLLVVLGWKRFAPVGGQPTAASSEKIMLAVLPFANMSGDPEQDYFSDGLTEEMIAHLGNLWPERLGVIARTSVMPYKKTQKTATRIGAELGVDYLVEGSVRRDENNLRITVQLIQVSDQTHLWADSFDRDLGDLLAVQEEMSGLIAEHLSLKLLRTDRKMATLPGEVWDAYWKGRYHWHKNNAEGFRQSVSFLEQAVAMAPGFAAGDAALADAYNGLGLFDPSTATDSFAKARAAAGRALELDENLGEAHAALGYALMHGDWDWSAAGEAFEKALLLSPGRAVTHHWAASYFSLLGGHERAVRSAERARKLDPLSHSVNGDLGWYFFYAGRFDDAIAQCRRMRDMEPNSMSAGFCLMLTLLVQGKWQDAYAFFEAELVRMGATESMLKDFAEARQDPVTAAAWIAKNQEASVGKGGGSTYLLSFFHATAGDLARSLDWLEQAFENRESWVVFINVDPAFDAIRSEPRFQKCLKRLGLPDDADARAPLQSTGGSP